MTLVREVDTDLANFKMTSNSTVTSFRLIFISIIIQCSLSDLSREKRFVYFPMGGLYKLVIGVAIPVKLGSKQSMAFAINFQFQYAVPTNESQLNQEYPPIISRSREKRNDQQSDRALAYLGVEATMDKYGINGRACLLRSICENALETLFHETNGVYGQILHIFLTPDYGDQEVDVDLNPDYYEAQKRGEFGNCNFYSNCQIDSGVLDLFSLLDY